MAVVKGLNPMIFLMNGLIYAAPTYLRDLINRIRSSKIYSPLKLLWRIVKASGGTHAQYQRVVVVLIGLIYIFVFVLIVRFIDPQPILLGSLIGAFPIVLFESNRYFQRPYLTITDQYLTKYPDRFHILDPIDKVDAENAVCIHAVVSNEGRETAEDATVRIRAGELDDTQYYTRWRDENRIYRDIAPGEQQGVHLMWIDLEDEDIELPTSDVPSSDNETQYPPGGYNRIRRWELSQRPIQFDVILRAKNTPERIVSVPPIWRDVDTEQLIEKASEWDAVKSIKRNYEHYAVVYERKDTSELHVPQTIDFDDFTELDDFEIPDSLDPREAIERTHEIVWIDSDGGRVEK